MATAGPKQLVYGPMPSRRLGRSLGIGLVPFKAATALVSASAAKPRAHEDRSCNAASTAANKNRVEETP